ncbi:MAG: histidinol phosphate phosphatase domain-containing protein [Endomicrobiia bacterium]
MIDLHTHTLFSDGELLPSELVYRAKVKGYTAICLSDHVDFSNIDFVIPRIIRICSDLTKHYGILVIPGAEITYVPPKLIQLAVKKARFLGAKIVIVHGETLAETVPPGTNLAGILSGADILAHPGRISPQDVKLAKEKKVYLEITSRKGHRDTNQHVAKLAKKYKTEMVFNTDTHSPENLITEKEIKIVLKNAKLNWNDFLKMQENSVRIIEGKNEK